MIEKGDFTKRIKKFLAFVLTLLMVFSLCACEKSTPQNPEFEYVAYEVGDMDALDFGTHENEYTLWSFEKLGLYQDETEPLEMTVEFNGKRMLVSIHGHI